MPNFSDALQGYENGANNAVRVGAERLTIPTPVQSFLGQLHQNQEMGLQQQQIQALGNYRQALIGNAGQRIDNQGQHYQDMAVAANAKQALAEDKLKQVLMLSNRRLDIQQQIANTNQATAQGKQKVLDLQAQLQAVDLQTRNALNQSKINSNNMGGMQRFASATKDTATTPGSGVANPRDAMTIYLKSQADADKYNRMNSGLPGFKPKVPLTPDQARDLAIQFNTAPNDTPPEDSPGDSSTPSPVPGGMAQLSGMDQLGSMGEDPMVPPEVNPLMAFLKRPFNPNVTKQLQGPGSAPAPPPPGTDPYPPPVNTTPNYPINAGPPVTGHVDPIPDPTTQQATLDPLHGMYSQRDPGVYSMNGRQYLVDGTGVIQALPT